MTAWRNPRLQRFSAAASADSVELAAGPGAALANGASRAIAATATAVRGEELRFIWLATSEPGTALSVSASADKALTDV